MESLWNGLRASARARLSQRHYGRKSLLERLGTSGVELGELLAVERESLATGWIPGVEVFPRQVFAQRHRGFFGELARKEEGTLAEIGLWPRQWATATMWPGSAKGFHIHPPFIPAETSSEAWLRRLYVEEPGNFALRPYEKEQWDVMFFVQGTAELFFVDERAGLERRRMRLVLSGDNHRGANNGGVVIPAGVAHALRAESSEDVIMVYGTSTAFNPAFEGRIESEVEMLALPPEWQVYWKEN